MYQPEVVARVVLTLDEVAALPWGDQAVESRMHAVFGPEHFGRLKRSLTTPPSHTCLRVNRVREADVSVPLRRVASHVEDVYAGRGTCCPPSAPYIHPQMPFDCIMLPSTTPPTPPPNPLMPQGKEGGGGGGGGEHKVIVVDRLCGEAVLRGADIYAKGVLAASRGVQEGDQVLIVADLDKLVLRGSQWHDYRGRAVLVAKGRTLMARVQLFRASSGLAVEVTERRWSPTLPPLNGFLLGTIYLQNLPSMVVAHVLGPQPGEAVIDLCSAPGGKATHIASLMGDKGLVVACDRSHKKMSQVKSLADEMGLTCLVPVVLDSLKACRPPPPPSDSQETTTHQTVCPCSPSPSTLTAAAVLASMPSDKRGLVVSKGAGAGGGLFFPESFDRVLLDPPCSALGLRPRLAFPTTMKDLQDFENYQRGFFYSAVMLLKPGGTLTYSTCTINPQENEAMVQWALDTYPCLTLLPATSPQLGGPGLPGFGLPPAACAMVQRFDPAAAAGTSNKADDTIGFFIAKFAKLVKE